MATSHQKSAKLTQGSQATEQPAQQEAPQAQEHQLHRQAAELPPYELKFKRIKNLNIRVLPPDGAVHVSAPVGTPQSTIDAFVAANADWVAHVQTLIAQSPQREADNATPEDLAFWRRMVKKYAEVLVKIWAPPLDIDPDDITLVYRNMRSRWGSCKPSTGRICLNIRLALYPPECLEYVIVHELCHMRVRNHGPEFWELLDATLPGWRSAKEQLED